MWKAVLIVGIFAVVVTMIDVASAQSFDDLQTVMNLNPLASLQVGDTNKTITHDKQAIRNGEGAYSAKLSFANLSINKFTVIAGKRVNVTLKSLGFPGAFSISSDIKPQSIERYNFTKKWQVEVQGHALAKNGTNATALVNITLTQEIYYPVPFNQFKFDNRTFYGITVLPSENYHFTFATPGLGQTKKYSYLINASDTYLELDPHLTDGLSSYYDFDTVSGDNITDTHGDLSAYRNASGVSFDAESNGGLSGGGTFANLSHGGFVRIAGGRDDDFTVCAWYNFRDESSSTQEGMLMTGSDQSAGAIVFFARAHDGRFRVRGDDVDGLVDEYNDGDSWKHLCYVINYGLQNGSAYLDGVKTDLNVGGNAFANVDGVDFGCLNNNEHPICQHAISSGGLDQIAFWDRQLSQNDVDMLFQNESTGQFCEGDPCEWHAAAPSDSCTDFESGATDTVDCTDGCTIDAAVDKGGADIEFSGDGQITITADVTNFGDVQILSSCRVICDGGCIT